MCVTVGGEDFAAVMETVAFGIGSVNGQMECVNLEILEDIIVELLEEFTVHFQIESGASSAVSHFPYADVHILDNERTFHHI